MPAPLGNGLYWLAMLLAALILYRARHAPDVAGLYWTFAAVFCAMALYHRFYDAAVVIVGWAAVFAHWTQHPRVTLAMVATLLAFAVPGTAFRVNSLGTSHPAWVEAILIRHQALALLGLGLVTAYGLLRHSQQTQADPASDEQR